MLMPADPEEELLFRLVRGAGRSSDATARIGELASEIDDWDRATALARRHSLLPQLHRSLDEVGGAVPSRVRQEVRAEHRKNAMRNLWYSQYLHDLYDLFRENGVRAIPYKGPTLAQAVYGSVSLRSFGDLDFLVAKGDVLTARELLLRHGCEQLNYPGVRAETLVEGTVFRWGREFRFFHGSDRVPVELRFEFIGGTRADSEIFEDVWARRTTTSLAGRPVSGLSPEDRALLLLVHGTKHGWRRLSWVYDVALLFESAVDWDVVLKRATGYGWRNAVLFGFAVVAELTDVTVPQPLRSAVDDHPWCTWAASALTTLLREDLGGETVRIEPIATVLFLNDDVGRAAAELLDVTVSPRKIDFEWVSLPPRLYPLYYLVRPCRIGANLLGKVADNRFVG